MARHVHDLAIIVPTMNRRDDLVRLLESIATQDIIPRQIIIVDGSEDSHRDLADRFAALNVDYVHSPRCSVAAARNLGISRLQDGIKLVCVLDDDIVFLDQALSTMLEYWNTAPDDVGIAVFNVVNFRDATALAYFKMLFWAWHKEKGIVMRSGVNTMLFPAHADKYVQWVPSGIMVLRSDILREFRYDEWYKTCFCEDLDFGYRVGKKYKLRIVSAARVRHLHSPGGRPDRIRFGKSQITDKHHFIRKDPAYFSTGLFHISNIGCILENLARGIFGRKGEYLKVAYGNMLGVWTVLSGRDE